MSEKMADAADDLADELRLELSRHSKAKKFSMSRESVERLAEAFEILAGGLRKKVNEDPKPVPRFAERLINQVRRR